MKIKIEPCIRTKTQSFFIDSIVSVTHRSDRGGCIDTSVGYIDTSVGYIDTSVGYIDTSVGRIDKIEEEEGFILLDMSDRFKSNIVTIYIENIIDIKAYTDTRG